MKTPLKNNVVKLHDTKLGVLLGLDTNDHSDHATNWSYGASTTNL